MWVSRQVQGHGWWIASDGRWYPPEAHPGYRHPSPAAPVSGRSNPYIKWAIGIGIGFGIALLALLAIAVVAGVRLASDAFVPDAPRDMRRTPAPDVRPLPAATLTVHSDGCGVIRSDLAEEPDGLTWSVVDEAGFQVLARNAAGETRYRYFQSGTYTVVLQAFDGRKYAPISNTVTIHC